MVDPLVAQIAAEVGVPEETVETVLRTYRNAITKAIEPGGEAKFQLFDLAHLRVTTEPVGPMHQPTVGKSRTVTASILGVYARTLHISPTLTMRASLEPILVSEEVFLGLFDESWRRWRHAFGPAEDVPFELWLAASMDPEKRADARKKLRSNLVRNGAIFQASAHAVTYLARLARSESIPERVELLGIAKSVIEIGRPSDAPLFWTEHTSTLRKERHAFEAMLEDPATAELARAILRTAHFESP